MFRLAVFVGFDDFPPMRAAREWFLTRWPSEDTEFLLDQVTQLGDRWYNTSSVEVFQTQDEGGGPVWIPLEPSRWAILVTCVWCLSMWLAGLAVAGRVWLPQVWHPLAIVLTLSAAASLINLLRSRG